MAALKQLDIGYGYTADRGRTFPFRGEGVGLMPELDEVLARFPDRRFSINMKSNDPAEGHALALYLAALSADARSRLMAYGGDQPIAALEQRLPEMRSFSRRSLKDCLLAYFGLGWSGFVPEACRRTALLIPVNIAPWLWGWPDKFLDRMDGVDTAVFLIGPYHGGFSQGLNTAAEIDDLPEGYSGGISTDAIEAIGPALDRRGMN